MQSLVTILVFAPLLGAIVAGLFGTGIGRRVLGDTPSMAVTTGLLFLACGLAWMNVSQPRPQVTTSRPVVTAMEAVSPIRRPNRPAMAAPSSGAKTSRVTRS